MEIRKYLFELTPLGKADKEVKKYIKDKADPEQLKKYERSLNYYRSAKLFQTIIRALLYASIITSIAATIGFDGIQILQRVASYIGATFLLILYVISTYFSMIRKESYHVQREILIHQTDF